MKKLCGLAISMICILVGITAAVHADTIPYSDVSPEDAHNMVTTMDNAYILDIRTPGEYYWVGHPGPNACGEGDDLSGKVLHIPYRSWRFDPASQSYVMALNPRFNRAVVKRFEPGDHIIIMSRNGDRSSEAVQQLADSENSYYGVWEEIQTYFLYNMVEGFEGGMDECGYRTLNEGWKNLGYPHNNSAEGLWRLPRRFAPQVVGEGPLVLVDGLQPIRP